MKVSVACVCWTHLVKLQIHTCEQKLGISFDNTELKILPLWSNNLYTPLHHVALKLTIPYTLKFERHNRKQVSIYMQVCKYICKKMVKNTAILNLNYLSQVAISSGITIMIITLKFPMVEIGHVDKHTTSHNPKLW